MMSVAHKKSTPREIRLLIAVLAVNVGILCAIGFAVGVWFFGDGTDSLIGQYHLDRDRYLNVYAREREGQREASLRYEVVVNGKVVVPRNADGSAFYFYAAGGATKNPRDFSVVPADRGDLVAITDRLRHDEIVILHDFVGNQSWPAHGRDDAVGTAIGRRLLRQVQREYPFFTSSGLSSYRPAWVWSPDHSYWLLTIPYSMSESDESLSKLGDAQAAATHVATSRPAKDSVDDADALLGLRVWSPQTRRACFIRTGLPIDEFSYDAAIGWSGNDVVVLALGTSTAHAWKIIDDNGVQAASLPLDEALRLRAAQLLQEPLSPAIRSPAASTVRTLEAWTSSQWSPAK